MGWQVRGDAEGKVMCKAMTFLWVLRDKRKDRVPLGLEHLKDEVLK